MLPQGYCCLSHRTVGYALDAEYLARRRLQCRDFKPLEASKVLASRKLANAKVDVNQICESRHNKRSEGEAPIETRQRRMTCKKYTFE